MVTIHSKEYGDFDNPSPPYWNSPLIGSLTLRGVEAIRDHSEVLVRACLEVYSWELILWNQSYDRSWSDLFHDELQDLLLGGHAVELKRHYLTSKDRNRYKVRQEVDHVLTI